MFFKQSGFTLAELLIALAILGVITTFTIPKVLSSQQNAKDLATAKEVAGMLSGAYQQYANRNGISTSTGMRDLTPYMNYVSVDTTSTIDTSPHWNTAWSCGTYICLRLHNGGTLLLDQASSYGGTSTTHNVWAYYDPDGTASATKSVGFFILYNGKVTSEGGWAAATCNSINCVTTTPASDPSWFRW